MSQRARSVSETACVASQNDEQVLRDRRAVEAVTGRSPSGDGARYAWTFRLDLIIVRLSDARDVHQWIIGPLEHAASYV